MNMQNTTDSEIDDVELLKELSQKIPGAIEKLCKKHGSVLRAVIMQVLHDQAATDDVLQEVLMQIWQRASTYNVEKGKLIGWLVTLARRRAIDHLRQNGAYRRAADRYEVRCKQDDSEVRNIHPAEQHAFTKELRSVLVGELQSLPEAQRVAIELVYFQDRTQREIAKMTESPLGTVKTRIELGIKKLSQSLSGQREQFFNC